MSDSKKVPVFTHILNLIKIIAGAPSGYIPPHGPRPTSSVMGELVRERQGGHILKSATSSNDDHASNDEARKDP